MKRLRTLPCTSLSLPRPPPQYLTRFASTVPPTTPTTDILPNGRLPHPPPSRTPNLSAKLPALHARLNLHPSFPLETLARALVHSSADADTRFNNSSLSVLGTTLSRYYITEHLVVTYPRLPSSVLAAAVDAYVGHRALAVVGQEWGVEMAFEPKAEVDAGLLQFRRLPPGTDPMSSPHLREGVTAEFAMAGAVRSVFAGVYLHEGLAAARQFFRQHIVSRKLEVHRMFDFAEPTRELSRLCAREGFSPPVARLMAETGRYSRNAVFVVGVYSGRELMGEGHGGSLDEARIRAAANALKGWYLYSPLEKDLPSTTTVSKDATFKPAYVDVGEVIV